MRIQVLTRSVKLLILLVCISRLLPWALLLSSSAMFYCSSDSFIKNKLTYTCTTWIMSNLKNIIIFIFTCDYVPMNKIKINRNNKKLCCLEACTVTGREYYDVTVYYWLWVIACAICCISSAARDTLAYTGRASASGSYPVTQTIIRL